MEKISFSETLRNQLWNISVETLKNDAQKILDRLNMFGGHVSETAIAKCEEQGCKMEFLNTPLKRCSSKLYSDSLLSPTFVYDSREWIVEWPEIVFYFDLLIPLRDTGTGILSSIKNVNFTLCGPFNFALCASKLNSLLIENKILNLTSAELILFYAKELEIDTQFFQSEEAHEAKDLCPDCKVYCTRRFIDGRCE